MSTTPSITLTGAQNEYMYKKTLGVAYELPNTQPSTETILSLPYIFNNNIIPYDIPIPAPTSIDISFNVPGGGIKWSTDNPYIFFYEKLPLSINPDNLFYSFVNTSDPSSNLTTHSIPSNYDPGVHKTYGIYVYDATGTVFPDPNYIFDNATGCLTCINGPFQPTYSGFPYISFYRYEGPFGVSGGSSQWTTSGNNIYNNNTGYVGINNTNPSSTLDVIGDINCSTCTTTSDYRIKKDIKSLDNTFNVDYLNPVIYKLRDTDKTQTGFIAHELQELYPFLVNGIKDGEIIQSINYSGLIPILVKEIQELKKEIYELKKK